MKLPALPVLLTTQSSILPLHITQIVNSVEHTIDNWAAQWKIPQNSKPVNCQLFQISSQPQLVKLLCTIHTYYILHTYILYCIVMLFNVSLNSTHFHSSFSFIFIYIVFICTYNLLHFQHFIFILLLCWLLQTASYNYCAFCKWFIYLYLCRCAYLQLYRRTQIQIHAKVCMKNKLAK